jgi:hypothetical protein
LLRQAGTSDAPLLEEVQRTWGQADVARREAAGALLTYRLQTCALVLGFSANSLNQMRLAAVEPGPRRFGDTPPSLDQCAAELDARRANARVG